MRRASILAAIAAFVLLGGCKRDFDDKYDDNLKQLNVEAAQIKASADKQISARQAADKAIGEGEKPNPQ